MRIRRTAYRNRTDDLRITSVFSCVARRFKSRATFRFAGCYWWRTLAVDGGPGASRGHVQSMECDRPHLAGDGPRPGRAGSRLTLLSDRSVRRGSWVKRDFTCPSTRQFSVCAGCPAVTVMLEAGGADERRSALPGPLAGWLPGRGVVRHGPGAAAAARAGGEVGHVVACVQRDGS
jgi:hypothetical protein